MHSQLSLAVAATLLAACANSDPETDDRRRLAAYDTLDSCVDYDEAACAENADRCIWFAIGAPCIEGEPCVGGVCQEIDPCRTHLDADACAADTDNRCSWAGIELCPADDCGDDGFCYQVTDDEDCTCVCPLECPDGEDCPPCECDCPEEGCVEPEPTCICPDCPEGTACEPCDCGAAEGTPETGADAPTFEEDPCAAYADEQACGIAPECAWLMNPCPLCESCECEETYACRYVGGGGGGCTCVCPDCGPGETCAPCECNCEDDGGGCSGSGSGGGSTGGTEPPWDQ